MDERTRTYSWEDPMASAQKGLQMAGIDYLNAMLRGEIPLPPILKTMNVTVGTIEIGKVTFDFVPEEFHFNPLGTVHGGVITTLLDSAMGLHASFNIIKGNGIYYTRAESEFLATNHFKNQKSYLYW